MSGRAAGCRGPGGSGLGWAGFVACPLLWVVAVAVAAPLPMSSLPVVHFADAIAQALRDNPSCQAAGAELERRSGVRREALAGALPVLNGNVLYTQLDHDRSLGGRRLAPGKSLNLAMTLVLPLLAPRAWGAARHAGDDLRVAAAATRAVRREVALGAGRAYIAVITQLRLTAVSEQAVTTAQAHTDNVAARLEAGVGTQLDLLRATQELASSQAQRADVAASLLRAREILGQWLGAETAIDVVPGSLDLPPLSADADFGFQAQALRLRPDVVAAQLRLQAAQAVRRDDWLNYLPNLQLQAQGFHQQPPTPTLPSLGWQLLLYLNVPFYDGGARYGQQRQHAAQEAQSASLLQAQARQASSELRAAAGSLEYAVVAGEAARRASAHAAEALQLANTAFAAGTANNLEVIDAELRARDAAIAAIVATDRVQQVRLELTAAAGLFPSSDA